MMGYATIKIDQPFSREYMSVSSIKLAEKCLLAYKRRYIDGIRHDSGEAATFGKLFHDAAEHVYRWVEEEEFVGKVPDEVIIRQYRAAFERSSVVGEANYIGGMELVRAYFRLHYHVDHRTVVALERDFTIEVEADDGSVVYRLYGVIDRVDRTGKDSIRIVDLKTNRFLFARDELDTDLQMSVYGLAAKVLWPWAKRVEYAFDMVRHDVRQFTRRSDDDLNMAADYIIAMTRRLERLTEFPASVNPLCPWCDDRPECKAYQDALTSGETSLSYLVASGDLEKVSAERDRCSALERIAKQRRGEMDAILMAHLKQKPDDAKLIIGDTRYMLSHNFYTDWPVEKTVAALSQGLNLPPGVIQDRILVVENSKVSALVQQAKLPTAKRQLLQAKLDSVAVRSPGNPWVNARNIKQRKA